jgi:hypothetical protein
MEMSCITLENVTLGITIQQQIRYTGYLHWCCSMEIGFVLLESRCRFVHRFLSVYVLFGALCSISKSSTEIIVIFSL